jgi:hypothetical protein
MATEAWADTAMLPDLQHIYEIQHQKHILQISAYLLVRF